MQNNDPIVIVGMVRTPMGAFQGVLSGFAAYDLGKAVIEESVKRSGLKATDIDDVIMGCVLSAGQGQAPARQATLMAGLPESTGAMTINKVCGSGMKAVMLAHDSILAGSSSIMVVGGMESMTNAPYMLDKARGGYRLGHGKLYDHMFLDGLEDAYQRGQAMGVFADETAEKMKFTREEQDEYAITSLARAVRAVKEGDFEAEIIPLTMKTRKGEVTISEDESPGKGKPEKIPKLRPAFSPDGTVTAGSSSSISDGAAAMVVMRNSEAEKRGLKVIAVVKAHASHSQKPSEFTLAPIDVTRKVMEKASWSVDDVELFEINEAFAVVTMSAIRELGLSHDKVNVNGGACALGHPIGASGARIIVTLLSAMEKRNLKKGVASLCIGGGEAVAVALERPA